jgi:hypothetical protein
MAAKAKTPFARARAAQRPGRRPGLPLAVSAPISWLPEGWPYVT